MLFSSSTEGAMSVALCLRNAGHVFAIEGKKPVYAHDKLLYLMQQKCIMPFLSFKSSLNEPDDSYIRAI